MSTPLDPRRCQRCGATFTPVNHRHRHCSAKCREARNNGARGSNGSATAARLQADKPPTPHPHHTPAMPAAEVWPGMRLADAERMLRDAGQRLVGVGEPFRELVYRLQALGDHLDPLDLADGLKANRGDVEWWLSTLETERPNRKGDW